MPNPTPNQHCPRGQRRRCRPSAHGAGAAAGLFARVWETAAPLHRPHGEAEALTARERESLVLLAAGRTDESGGSLLGVSVRTVRRLVAGLMDRLDARGRFEAGVKAARRAWRWRSPCAVTGSPSTSPPRPTRR